MWTGQSAAAATHLIVHTTLIRKCRSDSCAETAVLCDTSVMAPAASHGLPQRHGNGHWLGHLSSTLRAVALCSALAAAMVSGPARAANIFSGPCPPAHAQASLLEPVLHSILARDDLSDIDALFQALHIQFRLTSPSRLGGVIERRAILMSRSEFFEPSSFRYEVESDMQAGTTKIELVFKPNMPLALCAWGEEWKLRADSGLTPVFDGPVALDHYEHIHAAGDHSITLATDDLNREATFTQTLPQVISFPNKYSVIENHHSHLLQHVVDVMLSGDLRETGRIGKLLKTEIRIASNQAGFEYGTLAQPLTDADTSNVFYSINDAGWQHWISGGPCCLSPPQPAARSVELQIPVDTDAVCLSPQSIEKELKRRNVAIDTDGPDKLKRPFGADQEYSIRGNNLITLTDWLSGHCIAEFQLSQVTDVLHDVSYPLHFEQSDAAADASDALSPAGQAKVDALVWRLQRRPTCDVELVLNESPTAAKPEMAAVRQLASRVRRTLIQQGITAHRLSLAATVTPLRGNPVGGTGSIPAGFVSVQDTAAWGCRP